MEICSHFTVCGGCRTQDIPYAEQVQIKEEAVRSLFSPQKSLPILQSNSPWHYRNKMELSFAEKKDGSRYLGLRASGPMGGRVFNLTECHLCPPWMVKARNSVFDWWQKSEARAYFAPQDLGTLRTLTLREGIAGERMVMLTISGNEAFGLSEEDVASFAQAFDSTLALSSIVLQKQVIKKKSPTRFVESILYGNDHLMEQIALDREYAFKVRPTAFFQPNQFTASMLYQRALELAQLEPEDLVLDLYCGTATLGILAASSCAQVVGVELNPQAILDAKENICNNQIANMEVIEADVAKIKPEDLPFQPTVIFVDPPRSGLTPKAIKQLVGFRAKKIIYISCNPKTQKENVMQLEAEGYSIEQMQPIDQFPHTLHIENIITLTKLPQSNS